MTLRWINFRDHLDLGANHEGLPKLPRWHKINPFPVDTRRRFNVYSTSHWPRISVETTSCVYRVKAKHRLQLIMKCFQICKWKHLLKIGILKPVVTIFYKICKEYLGTWQQVFLATSQTFWEKSICSFIVKLQAYQ